MPGFEIVNDYFEDFSAWILKAREGKSRSVGGFCALDILQDHLHTHPRSGAPARGPLAIC